MHKIYAPLAGIISILLLAGSAAAADAPLKGDPRAVASIERMLERLGGRAAWAGARTLQLEYRVWRTDPDESLTELAWRDLRKPNQRIELTNSSQPVVWAFTPSGGWAHRRGEVVSIPPERHAEALEFWPYDFYTIIRLFAVGDPRINLEFSEPRRVVVKSSAGADWGWWEIDATGQPLKWGATSGDEVLEYVYGPVRPFGPIAFPAWGSSVDGTWRFEYASVSLSDEAIAPSLLKKPD